MRSHLGLFILLTLGAGILANIPQSLTICSQDVAEGQAQAFQALTAGRRWSECPTEPYLAFLHGSRSSHRVVIDVGCVCHCSAQHA